MQTKTICVLANSVKKGASCIAGIEVILGLDGQVRSFGEWVRPVGSADRENAIKIWQSKMSNGKQPKLLDLIQIPVLKNVGTEIQPENWLVDNTRLWNYRGRLRAADFGRLKRLSDNSSDLWLDRGLSTDRVSSRSLLACQANSLRFVEVSSFKVLIASHGRNCNKRRARFTFKNVNYELPLTDPNIQKKYFPTWPSVATGFVDGPPESCTLTVSLGEAWPENSGTHYKFVAAVL